MRAPLHLPLLSSSEGFLLEHTGPTKPTAEKKADEKMGEDQEKEDNEEDWDLIVRGRRRKQTEKTRHGKQ